MSFKVPISALVSAVMAMILAAPSLLQAHEMQKAQPEPNQAVKV
jgi:hypothetical protein